MDEELASEGMQDRTRVRSAPLSALSGNLDEVITGGAADDSLNGGSGNDTLDGGAGADTMSGGPGDDVYQVREAGDVVLEIAGEGIDTIRTTVPVTLPAHVEHVVLLGAEPISATGNGADNLMTGNSGNNALVSGVGEDVLSGGAGNDTLNGGTGADRMIGGSGDDVYQFGVGDFIRENPGAGTDTVLSAVNFTLGFTLENLTLIGSRVVNGRGNDLDNVLIGNAEANQLEGGNGNDTLEGGLGDDTLHGGAGDDVAAFDGPVSDYQIREPDRVTIGFDNQIVVVNRISSEQDALFDIETLRFSDREIPAVLGQVVRGDSGADALAGGKGPDTLDGGAGADTMSGGPGDDVYQVREAGDVVLEIAGEGIDTIRTTVPVTLPAHVEHVVLLGAEPISATGNGADNLMTGNSGDNALVSGVGEDVLSGGAGNDTLNGGTGADRMIGGPGDDVYQFGVGDFIRENPDAGTDTVLSAVNFTLGFTLENLTLIGSRVVNGRGNDLDNALIGNAEANQLEGGNGNDTLEGGLGDDTLHGGAGFDILSYASASERVEIDLSSGAAQDAAVGDVFHRFEGVIGTSFGDQLSGDSGANRIEAGDGFDLIQGRSGDDTMNGGAGADIFFFEAESFGNDIIEDFETGSDVLDFRLDPSVAVLSDLTIVSSGPDTLVMAPGGSIRLLNVDVGAIQDSDFLLLP